ncbi:MAG: hypothetical protein K8R44_00730 [Sulfurimonas sp.]|nr:hypothetical protein [Sulfurimonas sp.]
MKMLGKILFFNANDGNGIIITSSKKKINFNVQEWNDFDTMPSLGLEVCFKYENFQALLITSLINSDYENELVSENIIEDIIEEIEEENLEDELNDDYETFEEDDLSIQATDNTENQIEDINTIDDIQEELGEREESVTLTLNLSKAVSNYFDIIEKNISKRAIYNKVEGRLDYLLIRRFLWTTFNNLTEIDLHIITPKIKILSDDLKAMASIYDDFIIKTKHPPLAYNEVFLSCQAEYQKIKDGAEKTIERLNQLKGTEKHVGSILKIKKEELDNNIKTEEFDLLKDEFKSLNGAYVDIVHMMAELDERYKHDKELLINFEKEYRDDFYKLFSVAEVKYKKSIVNILSAQAFMLDSQLWQKSKTSKAIKAHFHEAGINGEFNTKTYLKYYLNSQDTSKLTDDNKKLLELYNYLSSIQKEHILIVTTSVDDAMEYESSIKHIDKSYEVKAFIDEKSALKWAIKHSVKVLILEDRLVKFPVNTFLKYYKKYVLVIPKIIILGDNIKSDFYSIEKLLSKNISPRVLAENVKELLGKQEDDRNN